MVEIVCIIVDCYFVYRLSLASGGLYVMDLYAYLKSIIVLLVFFFVSRADATQWMCCVFFSIITCVNRAIYNNLHCCAIIQLLLANI